MMLVIKMKLIKREEYLNKLISYKDKNIIKVITGIRRSGKSTLLKEFKDYLLSVGVKENNIISINFDDKSYSELLDADTLHSYIKDKKTNNQKQYLLFDEIQNVKEFQKCINSLFLNEDYDIYITGSNSYILSSELATYLTGRYIEIHILPLSFKEYIDFYGTTDELKKYNDYALYGGFPYLINLDTNEQKIEYLSSIYNTVIMKDVVNRKGINDVMMLESICSFLFDNIGSYVSTKKISDTLASYGRKNSVHTVEEYLNALLDSYILYKVNRYDIKGKQFLKTQEKYYLSDIGLRSYLLGTNNRNFRHILENILFLEFKRRGYRINIGKEDENEIDFVLQNNIDTIYVQVALSVRDEKVLDRELRPLKNINDNHKKYIITLDYDTNNYDGIKLISALDLLLGRIEL